MIDLYFHEIRYKLMLANAKKLLVLQASAFTLSPTRKNYGKDRNNIECL